MKSWLIQEEKKNTQRLPCETLCRSSLVKKKLVKHKKSNKKKTEKNARKGLYRLEFLRSFELSEWMKCYSYEWTISLAGITLFLTLWRGAYESFPLLWHSIQGLTLFTYSVYSVDRFSEPPNSSRCAYESGISGCISINSGWGGKCYIFTIFLYWSVVVGLAHSAIL